MATQQFIHNLRRWYCLGVLIICSCILNAQTLYLTKDSLTSGRIQEWRYSPLDSAQFSSPEYSDSLWHLIKKNNYDKQIPELTLGVQWYRMTFIADSSLENFPVALAIRQIGGASEIYLDGKLCKKYGAIDDGIFTTNSTQFDVLLLPTIYRGRHVLAIRYSNMPGLGIACKFQEANSAIAGTKNVVQTRTILSSITIVTSFIFALLHFFLFIFYRKSISDLLFSIFSFSVGFNFLTTYIYVSTDSNELPINAALISTSFALSIACVSIIHFTYVLLGNKRKFILQSTYFLGILSVITHLLIPAIPNIAFIILGIYAIVFCIGSVLKAIRKKVPGARILAIGFISAIVSFIALLFFCFMLLVSMLETLNFSTEFLQLSVSIFGLLASLSLPISMSIYHAWQHSYLYQNIENQENQVKELTTETIVIKHEKDEIQRQKTEEERLRKIAEEQRQLVEKQRDEIDVARRRSDELLENILPCEIALELKQKGNVDPVLLQEVTVLFADFVGFTKASSTRSPSEIVSVINTYFTAFDAITQLHGVEKIKTIGDAYMLASGVPSGNPIHARKVIEVAMEMLKAVHDIKLSAHDESAPVFDLRIGINSGPVIAGIVGVKKFQYDIWGDTVNTASRMETASQPGRINISESTYELVKEFFDCEYRGEIEVKGKGKVKMYFVTGTKA
jgi:class 3 adenylate cyclase